jgi:transposase-like protein
MAKKGQKFKKVSLEDRLGAVKERINTGRTYTYLGKKYGVSKDTVRTWVRIYNRDNGLDIQKKGRPKEEKIDYKERYEILKKFLEFLDEEEQDKR